MQYGFQILGVEIDLALRMAHMTDTTHLLIHLTSLSCLHRRHLRPFFLSLEISSQFSSHCLLHADARLLPHR
jgi:hypothetical protein